MPNFAIKGIDHIVIRASNLENLAQFYCDVLGCSLEKRNDQLGLIHLRAGTALIDLISVDGQLGKLGGVAAGIEGRNLDHFCLRIDPFDADHLIAYLNERGIEVSEIQNNYGAEGDGPSLYLKDPENNVIELKGAS